MSLSKGVKRLCFLFSNTHINQTFSKITNSHRCRTIPASLAVTYTNNFHTSCVKRDLMEFFDDPKNWGEISVKVGRGWRKEELRIKSNSDLHKLWYILLKERNMLLTMQHEYFEKFVAFPNPERLDKVEESMENIEAVVRERNRAYYELETGETGERPVVDETNCFGLPFKYKMRQYPIEKRFNTKFLKEFKLRNVIDDHKVVAEFLKKFEEKKRKKVLYRERKLYKVVCNLFKRFENVDVEALKAQFPTVDIEKARNDPKSRGHRENAF